MPMNPEVKALWVTALRSGEYQQGQGVLRRNDHYCCLGVLCELAVAAEGVDVSHVARKTNTVGVDNKTTTYTNHRYDDEATVLPPAVLEWSGLDHSNPDTSVTASEVPKPARSPNTLVSVAELNDGGWSFEQIADVIERDF